MPFTHRLSIVCLVLAASASPGAVQAATQEPAPATAPAAAAPAGVTTVQPAAPLALALDGPTAMVFHVVKGDRSADFEALFNRLQEGLRASGNEARRKQSEGWRLLKQNAATAEGHAVYVSLIDPVVAGQEYDMARLLDEAYPDEGLTLYQTLIAVHVQPTVQASNLTPVTAAGVQP